MTSSVKASPVGLQGWIRRGWDRAIPARFRVETTIDGFDVHLDVVVGPRGPQAVRVTVEQPLAVRPPGNAEADLSAPGVTLTVLRKITVDQIIREAIGQLEQPITSAEAETGIRGTFRVPGAAKVWRRGSADTVWADGGVGIPGDGRGRDTSTGRLWQVARIYQSAVAAGMPPVKAVAEEMSCSRSTAGRLVGEARKAGFLEPTTPGRVSAVPGAVPEAPIEPVPGPAVFLDPATYRAEEE
jgi:hypothetical protein